ncbi:hypothetical protein N9893_02975, partial [bacterium]|nr:hypothetical protein [bacterium]
EAPFIPSKGLGQKPWMEHPVDELIEDQKTEEKFIWGYQGRADKRYHLPFADPSRIRVEFEKIPLEDELPDEDGIYLVAESDIHLISALFNASVGIFTTLDGEMVLEPVYWLNQIK